MKWSRNGQILSVAALNFFRCLLVPFGNLDAVSSDAGLLASASQMALTGRHRKLDSKSFKTALANLPGRNYALRSFFGNLRRVTVVAARQVRKDLIYGS